ncbi:MAG: peptidoglycan DD-metalloendopeptidase family protein [Nevskia sp.]
MALIAAFLSVSTAAIFYFRPSGGIVIAAQPALVLAESTAPKPLARPSPAGAYNDIIDSAVNDALVVPAPTPAWNRVLVAPGQSLSNIFEDQGLPREDWIQLTQLGGDCSRLRHIKAGDHLNLRLAAGRLEELSYAFDETHTLSVRRNGEKFESATLTAALEHRTSQGTGVIRNSLFADGRKAGLPDRMILEFADIFGYDIDFAQDLQEGDHFSVVYDQLFKDGKKLREGDILAAEFVNQGRVYRAVRYVDSDGRASYFTPEGQALRKAFIRTPVDFARISSGFNLHRLHPILNIIRAHKGVDYAAAIGTPVHATGDGKVEFVGKKSGYGNVLMIRHGAQYETVYGHLSRFQSGLSTGSKVRQGQVVAYVGMTGLATAPHLHYEFRVNGIHQNPITVALPRAIPLSPQLLANFRARTAPLVAQINALGNRAVASAAR